MEASGQMQDPQALWAACQWSANAKTCSCWAVVLWGIHVLGSARVTLLSGSVRANSGLIVEVRLPKG